MPLRVPPNPGTDLQARCSRLHTETVELPSYSPQQQTISPSYLTKSGYPWR